MPVWKSISDLAKEDMDEIPEAEPQDFVEVLKAAKEYAEDVTKHTPTGSKEY